jgi:hypothetical protein
MFQRIGTSFEVFVMMVQTACPACGKTGSVPTPYLGKTVGCKRCNTLFKVRTATAPASALATAPRIMREQLLMDACALNGENGWWDDMPPIMVDIPVQLTEERVPA